MKFSAFLFSISLFLLTSISGHTQEKNLDSLKTILSSKVTNNIKEDQAIKFIESNKSIILPDELGNCYQEYGKWFYIIDKKKKANLKKAIFFTKKALNIKREHKVSIISLKKTLYNLAIFYTRSNNYFEAIKYYQIIKEISEVDKNTLSALRELSKLYTITGDFYKALINLNGLIDLSSKDTVLRKKTMQAYEYRANVYSLMGWEQFSRNIKEDAFKADSILNLIGVKNTKYHNRLNQLEGNRLLENGFYRESIVYFEKVLKGVPKNDSINIARGYNSLGQSYAKLKDDRKAFYYFDKALLYDQTNSVAIENKGDVFLEQKQYDSSLKEYQKAINILLLNSDLKLYDVIPQKSLEEAKDKYFLLHHLIQKAKAFIAYYHAEKDVKHLQSALVTFESADKLIDIIRFESTEVKSKLFWREQGADLYLGAVEVCYLLNNPAKALYFMEKNKAILLLEDISNYQAVKNAKLPLDIASKEVALKNEIHKLESKLQQVSKKENNNIESVKRALYLSKRKYATFVDSLVVAYPEYGKYKRKLPIITYQQALEKSKKERTNFLQYITNDDKGYGLLIGERKTEFFEINNAKALPEEIQTLQNFVTQKINTRQQQQAYYQIANTLFEKLIPEQVFQQIKGKEVIVIPDYRLQKVAFETLITTKNTANYFIKDAVISYAYSLSHLENNNQIDRVAPKGFLAVAPVDFTTLNLPSLHYTVSEVNTTNSIFNGTTLLNENAKKANFLDQGNQYKGLHLATHAEVNDTETPWIAFNDEKLSLQEIYGYKNEHEIVTLSACKTSLGELQLGEGVMSLARGFFYGGAKSVVSSLWSSNDKTNEQIITNFYQYLNNGDSKSKALQKAKLDYLKTHDGIDASPFYWGSYILIGDVSVVDLSTPSFNWMFILGGLLLIAAVGLFFFRRKS
ncbi:CHAT domain-containing protein [Tenacibaculum sp. M341]|uniref:CHAT domain-containing protein n=1 Tax=Tenacibaculum sp. M341 TaxID=2530339 RepID=UPI001048FC1C|nr:CHAT domain-containing protein [Tenacibaculum sp. M341]TCI90205.1 CHAT domain-containing protein [Tenacibaculum sp. M341]